MKRSDEQRLERIINARHRLTRQKAKERAAVLKAEVEDQLNSAYHFDDDEVWAEARARADAAAQVAQQEVAARCRELGIPAQFQPRISAGWSYGGGSSLSKEAKAEARRQAHARIESLLQTTFTELDGQKLQAQTALLSGNLEGADAIAFLDSLPEVSELMPSVQVDAHKLLLAQPKGVRGASLPEGLLSLVKGED